MEYEVGDKILMLYDRDLRTAEVVQVRSDSLTVQVSQILRTVRKENVKSAKNATFFKLDSLDSYHSVYINDMGFTDIDLTEAVIPGTLNLNRNPITVLKCPQQIGGSFLCDETDIASLKGCPEVVDGIVLVSGETLQTYKYLPISVENFFIKIAFDGIPKIRKPGYGVLGPSLKLKTSIRNSQDIIQLPSEKTIFRQKLAMMQTGLKVFAFLS